MTGRRGGEETYGLDESRPPDLLLLLALGRVIKQHPGLEDMQLPLGEPVILRQEGAVGPAERVRQTEAVHQTAENRKGAHQREQPEPPRLATHTTHMQDTIRQQLGAGLAELVAEVEDHDALGRLLARVPRRQRPQATRDETRLRDAQEEASDEEGGVALLEGLEGGDGAEEEELEREPPGGTDAVQDHVGGDFGEHDAEGQHLLADVKLVLVDADVFHELVGERVGDVAAIEL